MRFCVSFVLKAVNCFVSADFRVQFQSQHNTLNYWFLTSAPGPKPFQIKINSGGNVMRSQVVGLPVVFLCSCGLSLLILASNCNYETVLHVSAPRKGATPGPKPFQIKNTGHASSGGASVRQREENPRTQAKHA
mmetsp:Transcript_131493/g.195915  ORF Transcript_131493/g.195915 Transcript_131493/m.195915 type:complete len:134 (+) Transcript_131493:855-1256(+)